MDPLGKAPVQLPHWSTLPLVQVLMQTMTAKIKARPKQRKFMRNNAEDACVVDPIGRAPVQLPQWSTQPLVQELMQTITAKIKAWLKHRKFICSGPRWHKPRSSCRTGPPCRWLRAHADYVCQGQSLVEARQGH